MDFFISSAYASGAGAQQGGGLSTLIFLVLMVAVFYFLIIRPQSKRVKEHKNLVESLSNGDEVLLQGGLIGRIERVEADNDMMVLSLTDSVNVTVQKGAVAAVLPKGSLRTL
ncbi:MAG: preprotein translocase subunit YajC [Idiomarina sp.]|nr:preprotein translocase subunit YajC [Idiomarina sp.]